MSESTAVSNNDSSSSSNCRKILSLLYRLPYIIKQEIIRFHMSLFLIMAIVIGLVYPEPGIMLHDSDLGGGICITKSIPCIYNSVHYICVCGIFFISGLSLNTLQVKKAINSPKGFSIGMFLITILTPIMAFPVAASPQLRNPVEFALGLATFFAVPSTLNVGVSVTRIAHGNVALAILLTVVSNFVGVFLVPIYISWLLPICYQGKLGTDGMNINVKPSLMIFRLVFAILVPMIAGKVIRDSFSNVSEFVKKHREKLSFLSSFFIAVMAWMEVSAAADLLKSVSMTSIGWVLFIFISIHLFYFVQNYFISMKLFKISEKECKAVVIMGMQKSAPIAFSILVTIPKSAIPSIAMASIPIILSQLVQTFIDSIIAAKWAQYSKSKASKRRNTAPTSTSNVQPQQQDVEQTANNNNRSNDGPNQNHANIELVNL